MTIFRSSVDTPIGGLSLVADENSLLAILFDAEGPYSDESTHDPARTHLDLDEAVSVLADEHPVLLKTTRQLGEYFNRERRSFSVPIAPRGTRFQQRAWQVLTTIDYGSTITYGQQAAALGDSHKARAVGAANARNPIPIVVPCHRVVGKGGSLTGFAGGLSTKQWLISHERDMASRHSDEGEPVQAAHS